MFSRYRSLTAPSVSREGFSGTTNTNATISTAFTFVPPTRTPTKSLKSSAFIISSKPRSRDTRGFSRFKDFEDEEHYIPKNLRSKSYREHAEAISMHSSHVQEPERREETNKGGKGTGFNEPFGDKNTTLTHPDADTSRNATIEAADIVRTHSRRSFLGRHHSKNSVHGKLTPEETGLYDHIVYADGSTDGKSSVEIEGKKRDSGVHTGRSQESLDNVEMREDSESSSQKSSKKRNLLKKLHMHK